MPKFDLFNRVGVLGYPLFDKEDSGNANLTLADMVKSRESRLWEGFPLVLANSAQKGIFQQEKVVRCLKKQSDKSCLASLSALSLALYKHLNLKFSWARKLYASLPEKAKKEFGRFLKDLKKEGQFRCAGKSMSGQRLRSVFGNYFSQEARSLNDLLSVKDELSLEFALSQVFSAKQKELFYKKLKRDKLTKTEREYFSRVVKKKVLALANPELHRLSLKLLESM